MTSMTLIEPEVAEALLLAAGNPPAVEPAVDEYGLLRTPRAPLWRPGGHLHHYAAVAPVFVTPRTRTHRHGRLITYVRVLGHDRMAQELGLRRIELAHWTIALSGAVGAGWVVGQIRPMPGHGAQFAGIARRGR
ncbi:hypothetical protein ACFYUL_17950 [Streptomyces sp. NPDC004311]|uniref:hypothetical protein n=1 Tax=Streptomyces sp. NPDC004311 TaxID=3364698 RepID=UPI003687E3D9